MGNFIWQGRVDAGVQERWHQCIEISNNISPESIVTIGFNSDAGVKRNQGRPGASKGPDSIRKMLASLVYSQEKKLSDLGNIVCEGDALEQAQENLATSVAKILNANSLPIILGGGHEVAWGTYQGLRLAHSTSKIGIINFDAHFDLRPLEPKGSSGTPFRQAAEWSKDNNLDFNYLVYGINKSVNTRQLFDYAEENNVKWRSDTEINLSAIDQLKQELSNYCKHLEHIYITVCLDVFPAAYAPGVSAPGTPGVDPSIILKLIENLVESQQEKIIAFEIAEMNPSLDIDNRTAKLAARLIQNFVATLS